jgi:predicted nuclease of restriction endonuclease-like (RecB) superfamily
MEDNTYVSIDFIKHLKQQILRSRFAIAKIANAESLKLYYAIGNALENKFLEEKWGSKILEKISHQLQQELPGLRGFSWQNLSKMRVFYAAWSEYASIYPLPTSETEITADSIYSLPTSKLPNGDLFEANNYSFQSVSFTHHYEIILKIKDQKARWYYINSAAHQLWTVEQLRIELKNQSHLQEQKLPNNFTKTMPDVLSNKAIRAFKDQYLLDFVTLEDADDELDERVLEQEIVQNIKKFLMSLGNDFTFMGNQYRLRVSEEEYFIDLLFYHRGLQSLVAFDLKKGKFKPEYIGKMNFYLSALDDLVKQPHENPSIGIILCKEKDDKKVEYSFRDISKPMGVATYKTSETLPPELQKALPDAETLKKLLD